MTKREYLPSYVKLKKEGGPTDVEKLEEKRKPGRQEEKDWG
jgi:hypothetical protein